MGFKKPTAATDPPTEGGSERNANGSTEQPESADPNADPVAGASSLQADDAVAVLDAARAEAAEHYDRFLRARAELDNVQKRHERELEERAKYAVEPLALDLLTVVDDLERAKAYADEQGGSVAEGVDLVLRNLLDVLTRHGIERVAGVGAAFDPAIHEAVAVIESDEVPTGTVLQEHRAGYTLKGRLLRAAMVVVAKAPA
jgi:molecular chaperone GrpE